jgi:hypothetical protein
MRFWRFVRESFLSLVVSSLMLPGLIAAATVFFFLTGPYGDKGFAQWNSFLNRTPARACFFGALVAAACWVALGVLACRRFTRAKGACPGPFDQLNQGFDAIRKRLSEACSHLQPTEEGSTACREGAEHSEHLSRMFEQPTPVGLPWLLGTGYIDGWRRLHAMEEALIFIEPAPSVVRDALGDEMRLSGSNIPQNTALLKRLRTAVHCLSPSASRYLIEPPAPVPQKPALFKRVRTAAAQKARTAARPGKAEAEARAVLAQVKGAINEFRDSRREGLVRARNRLFGTVIFSGITGCTLLYVAILSGADKTQILAATAFYLVGGIVGLVKQLQSAATGATASQDDYGLGVVRLIQTPLLAGLAAIGGVVLVQLTAQQTPAAGPGGQAHTFSLQTTFDLSKNPYGLVAAAFFGLTPALLLSSLQQRIDQYRTDLSKSGPAESQGPGE